MFIAGVPMTTIPPNRGIFDRGEQIVRFYGYYSNHNSGERKKEDWMISFCTYLA
jgi:hypothetical protein